MELMREEAACDVVCDMVTGGRVRRRSGRRGVDRLASVAGDAGFAQHSLRVAHRTHRWTDTLPTQVKRMYNRGSAGGAVRSLRMLAGAFPYDTGARLGAPT